MERRLQRSGCRSGAGDEAERDCPALVLERGHNDAFSRNRFLPKIVVIDLQVVVVEIAKPKIALIVADGRGTAGHVFAWKRRKGIGSSDAAKGGAVERDVPGRRVDDKPGDVAIFENGEFERELALLENWRENRRWKQVIPVAADAYVNLLEVRTEIDAARVAQDFGSGHGGGDAIAAATQAIIPPAADTAATIPTIGGGSLRGLGNRVSGGH